jgi:hypothetical protein
MWRRKTEVGIRVMMIAFGFMKVCTSELLGYCNILIEHPVDFTCLYVNLFVGV